jgi:hypothetical protein
MAWLSQQDYQDYGGDLVNFSQRAAMEAVAPALQNLEQENARLQHWLGVEARHRMDAAVELGRSIRIPGGTSGSWVQTFYRVASGSNY